MIFLLGVITIHIFKNASMFVALSARFRLSNCAHLKGKKGGRWDDFWKCNYSVYNMAWLSLLKWFSITKIRLLIYGLGWISYPFIQQTPFFTKSWPTFIRGSEELTYLVTLNILSSLRALRTDRPKEPAFGLKWVQITSKSSN